MPNHFVTIQIKNQNSGRPKASIINKQNKIKRLLTKNNKNLITIKKKKWIYTTN